MDTTANRLLDKILEAHGGYERWKEFDQLSALVVAGGTLWGMKKMELDALPRKITATFRREWTRSEHFGNPEWHMEFTPERVVIAAKNGDVVAEQENVRETFAGHTWESPWNPLQLGYFNGYAIWTYYNLPFVLAEPGFEVADIPSVDLDGERLSGLRVRFPKHIHSHCAEQSLYFDERGLLRRHDYQVDVAGSSLASHFISDYVGVSGLQLPTKRRVFRRNEDGTMQLDRHIVTIDLSGFELS